MSALDFTAPECVSSVPRRADAVPARGGEVSTSDAHNCAFSK